jgi:xanthine dehydrogenase molybdopterin binding subunit/xanthine dehydrogenase small subunit
MPALSGKSTAAAEETFSFVLNGQAVTVRGESCQRTLLDYLRQHHHTGTKLGCAEGDCGACSVIIMDQDSGGQPCYRTLNSCITLLPQIAGRQVFTVEGLKGESLHPAQACLVDHYGSQCGFCTPGFVMSLFEAYYRKEVKEPAQIADQLCGNLCRCTGYRPIREAALAMLAQRPQQDAFTEALRRWEGLSTLDYAACSERFLRPASLNQLLDLKARLPQARLIAGATEIGVEITKKSRRFPLLISTEGVPELRQIEVFDTEWSVGAGATLTAIEETLWNEYPSLRKMLSVFASRQIRNRATLGGNLATASPIGDMAPVLLSLDASLVLASVRGEHRVPLDQFFTGYRQTVLQPDEIIKSVIIPRRQGWRTGSYKVSKRRELDISIVAAALALKLDAHDVIQDARLAFGGVAATPTRAFKTERKLIGVPLAMADHEDILALLRTEFKPLDDVRGGADYRQGLIVSLWEKFLSGATSEGQDLDPTFAVASGWPHQADAVSRTLKHESACHHVTGQAQYVDDVAQQRPMLDLWPICSPHAHARILRRDVTAARARPGVVAVLLAEDIPGHNDVGAARKDEILLADKEVSYNGHLIGIVVGESIEVCRAAAAQAEIEYEPLPAILSVAQARAMDSYHTEANFMRRGDSAAGLKTSPHLLEGEFSFGGQEHFYLETQAAWAEVTPEGEVFVSSSTQHPSEIQTIVAEVLGLSRNRVVVQAPRMGGGFGGKETQGNTWAALTALAAFKTGRPVRVQLDRDLDMMLTGKRHPFYAKFKVGYDDQGKFTAAAIDLISNGGWSLDLSMPVTDRAMFHVDNAYYIPNLTVSGRVAKTHLASNTAFRGFGGPQGMLVIEEIIDRIARTLKIPAELVRERNFYHGSGETNTTHYGEEIEDNRIQKIWTRLKKSADWEHRKLAIAEWNAKHPRLKRGLAITPVKFGISFTLTHYNQAGALVLIYYQDGTVQVNHGGTEMGQGLYTKILGIVMRELGLTEDRIRMMKTTTDKVPNTSATAASSGSDLNGAAVQEACLQLRERLATVAAGLLSALLQKTIKPAQVRFINNQVFAESQPQQTIAFETVTLNAYQSRISLSAQGFYKTPDLHWDRAQGRGKPFHYFAFGAAITEVEVDGFTGMTKLRRVDILHDVGDSLNPSIDRGQIEGGYLQGVGWLTKEELKWSPEGMLQTHSASTYQIPAFSDAPTEFNVELLPEAAQNSTIHGSKAVGEPPLMLAISAREAIREAIAAFGPKPGPIELPSPATHEAIFLATQQQVI